jgi:hypothetical protein
MMINPYNRVHVVFNGRRATLTGKEGIGLPTAMLDQGIAHGQKLIDSHIGHAATTGWFSKAPLTRQEVLISICEAAFEGSFDPGSAEFKGMLGSVGLALASDMPTIDKLRTKGPISVRYGILAVYSNQTELPGLSRINVFEAPHELYMTREQAMIAFGREPDEPDYTVTCVVTNTGAPNDRHRTLEAAIKDLKRWYLEVKGCDREAVTFGDEKRHN